jgi:ubiquinone/menaquinone biosynthesis C-methylase UbiE
MPSENLKQTLRAQWDSVADSWHRWAPVTAPWMIPLTEVMFDMAGIAPGHRVLDVAAGTGQQTMMAAKRVGKTGHVLSTDLSPRMLHYAEEGAKKNGLAHVKTQVMDAEELTVAANDFNAIVCRIGLNYFPVPQAALSGMYRALKKGGRAALSVLSSRENNALFAIPMQTLERHHLVFPPEPPNLFCWADEKKLERALLDAGFRAVETCAVPTPLKMRSTGDCVHFLREAFGTFHAPVAGTLPETVWQEMERGLGRYGSPRGFTGPCEALVAVGLK